MRAEAARKLIRRVNSSFQALMTELMEMAQKLKACDDFQERLALLKRSRDILNEAYRLIGIAPHRDDVRKP